jgi:hypothetical protein
MGVGGGVQLGPLATAVINKPIVSTPGDYDGEICGMMIDRENGKYSEKTCPSAALSATNPTCSTRKRTRVAAVGSQRLTARPMKMVNRNLKGNRLVKHFFFSIHIILFRALLPGIKCSGTVINSPPVVLWP